MSPRDDAPKSRAGLAGLAQANGDGHPLFHAVGGLLGILETLLPGLVFVVLYLITGLPVGVPWVALVASVALSVAFTIVRMVRHESVLQAVVGLIGVVASAVLVVVSGRPENNFIWGIVTNAVYGVAVLVSLLIRWPLVGVIVGMFRQEHRHWRRDREYMRVYVWATVMWLGMFVIRLAVETPLLVLAQGSSGSEHQALVTALAVTKIALGLPLYVPVLAATWLLVRGLWREKPQPETQNKVS